MNNDLLKQFYEWLTEQLSSKQSASSYLSRLKRAFKIWNKNATFLKPIEKNIDIIVLLADVNPETFQFLIIKMLSYVSEEQSKNNIKKGPAQDVFTSIRKFEDWCLGLVTSKGALTSQQSVALQNAISNIKSSEATDDLYSPESLNLRRRIASRNSKSWPARKLGKYIGNKKENSWITETLKHVIVLTDHGPHHLNDIDLFRLDTSDVLYVHPIIYSSQKWAKVLGYDANGSIQPLIVKRNSQGLPDFSSVSLEHSPAISIIINSGRFPEFSKLNSGKTVNVSILKKEFNQINHIVTYTLMDRQENIKKGNKW